MGLVVNIKYNYQPHPLCGTETRPPVPHTAARLAPIPNRKMLFLEDQRFLSDPLNVLTVSKNFNRSSKELRGSDGLGYGDLVAKRVSDTGDILPEGLDAGRGGRG